MAYVVLATFFLSLHLYTNWKWWANAGAIIAVAIFYFVTYFSIPQMLGWPTSYGLPEKFRLVAYRVKDNKNIYIWAQKIQSGYVQPKPRSYVLPYTNSLHKNLAKTGQRMNTGVTIIGEVEDMSNNLTPKNAESITRRTEQLNITFQDAPKINNLTKD